MSDTDDLIMKLERTGETWDNFLSLPPEFSASARSRFVVIPAPFEQTTSFGKGAALGAQAVLEASRQVELHDVETGAEPFRLGVHTDFSLRDSLPGPEGILAAVEAAAGARIDAGQIPVLIGGEHTVSAGAIRAAAARRPNLTVLQFDAHADLRDEYDGSKLSHASAMRRALDGAARPAKLLQVGVRSMCPEEIRFSRGADFIHTILAKDILSGAVPAGEISGLVTESVYITIDMDAFDPSLVPAVGTPEPGGLDWRTVVEIIKAAARRARVVGFDVVELAPIPGALASQFIAAKLLYRTMGFIAE